MATSKRTRDLERARQERQAARRVVEQQARKRRNTAVYVAIGSVVLVLAVVATLVVVLGGSDKSTGTATPSTPPSSSAPAGGVACEGTGHPPVTSPEQFPSEPPLTIDPAKTYTMVINSSCGAITSVLNAAKAPRTVNTLSFLAEKKFYDGTPCHRMVISDGLTVLQCGDPTGSGSGGPGFTIGEENLEGATYPRGTIAMAKTSAPNSTSSQFFLVAADSQLPPQYTPVGKINDAGLQTLDKLMAVGTDQQGGVGDGAPAQKIYLDSVTVGAT